MKIVYVVLNISDLDKFIETIHALGFREYQIIEQLLSCGALGNPRMNTSVWPGYSAGIIIETQDEEKLAQLLKHIKQHNENRMHDEEIIRAFVWNAEHCITS